MGGGLGRPGRGRRENDFGNSRIVKCSWIACNQLSEHCRAERIQCCSHYYKAACSWEGTFPMYNCPIMPIDQPSDLYLQQHAVHSLVTKNILQTGVRFPFQHQCLN